ncbi:MAG: 4,5-DOPA dioxygenase extradiol [Anaerolineaceae bacterium]
MLNENLPVIFFGHGSPMNAIEVNDYTTAWRKIGESLSKPKAVLCISSHWVTYGLSVTSSDHPRTTHDFLGFPQELFDFEYPAPGSKELARRIVDVLAPQPVSLDETWGLDHGCWSVLKWLFPAADVPVVQLSIDHTLSIEQHFRLGNALRALRSEEILIVGSGNIVHNLTMASWDVKQYGWAVAFDERVKNLILAGDYESIIHYERQGPNAAFAVNSREHFIPLIYVLGASFPGEKIRFFSEEVMAGSISMRGVQIG